MVMPIDSIKQKLVFPIRLYCHDSPNIHPDNIVIATNAKTNILNFLMNMMFEFVN